MAAVQQRILNWLYSVLTSEYHDVNRTYNDVAQALSFYSSLTPRTDVYTYENGASALLLQLSGTLPVQFRGTTYRFPIALWIPHAYPNEAPLVYVTPTESMAVRAGQHVDPQGKVYHPYLVGWAEFADKSNVLDFLAILREIFAKEPPVVARQQTRPAANSPRPGSIPPPIPPLPSELARSSPQPSVAGSSQAPPPPPKPYSPDSTRSSAATQDARRESGPPLPPLPPGMARPTSQGPPPLPPYQNTQSQYQPQRQSSLRYESAPPLPPHPQPSQGSNYSSQPQGGMQSPPPNGPHPPAGMPPQSYQQQYNVNQYPSHANQPPLQHQQNWQQPPPQPQQPKPKPPPVDLLDGPLTLSVPAAGSTPLPAPPIPPNPEKDMLLHTLANALYAQRQKSRAQTESSLPGLRAQHAAMRSTLSSMQIELTNLSTLSETLSNNTAILHSSMQAADNTIKSSQHREPPKIDEILVAPTVVGNQLYDLVSEERALGDALFILGRAVERGRVGAGPFVKATRGLAREWFLKKALVRKIGRGMGLESGRR